MGLAVGQDLETFLTLSIAIQRERMRTSFSPSPAFRERECTLNCVNFEQNNDYESENIVKIMQFDIEVRQDMMIDTFMR